MEEAQVKQLLTKPRIWAALAKANVSEYRTITRSTSKQTHNT